ncbi:MAG TPA: hypothetical protein VKJ00_04335 [Thermoanaerobaculia bacterium]|nr:hypothetical protein [Thermoanaerobaculia bacterium]
MRTAGLIALALAAAVSTLSADEDYAIRLSRAHSVGDRYRLDARGRTHDRQRVTVGGRETENSETEVSVHLVAAATVLAVDTKLQAIRTEYRIESCQKSSSGKTSEVLPAGRKVIAESKAGETVFTIDGQPAGKETAEALKAVISSHDPDSPTDDEISGTTERKRIGDTWSINAATAARLLSKEGVSISPEDLHGTVRLEGVRTINGVKALELSLHLRADKLRFAAPEGLRLEKSAMEGDFTSPVAVDTQSRSHLPDKLHLRFNMLMTGQKPDTGEKVAIEADAEMTQENSYSPIPEETKSPSSLESGSTKPVPAAGQPQPGAFRTVTYVDLVCGRMPAIPASFSLPADYVSRAIGRSVEGGCIWGTQADLDRVTAVPEEGDFSALQRGVFRARVSTNIICNPQTGIFDAMDGTGEAGIKKQLEGTGASLVTWKKEWLGGLPALQIVADLGSRGRVYMLYLGNTRFSSNVLLLNYYQAKDRTKADDETWAHFVAGIRKANTS